MGGKYEISKNLFVLLELIICIAILAGCSSVAESEVNSSGAVDDLSIEVEEKEEFIANISVEEIADKLINDLYMDVELLQIVQNDIRHTVDILDSLGHLVYYRLSCEVRAHTSVLGW